MPAGTGEVKVLIGCSGWWIRRGKETERNDERYFL